MPSDAVHAPLVLDSRLRLGASRRRRLVVAFLLLASAVIAAVLFFRSRPAPPRFRTANVERRTITREIDLTGHLAPLQRVEVRAPIVAQLVEIVATVGQKVATGDTLARLDRRALVIAARGATAGVSAASSRAAEANAAVRAAAERRERLERLRARDLASQSELDAAVADETEARAAFATARAEQARATATLSGARLTESSSTLSSPIDGVVLQAPDSTGTVVDPSSGALFVVGSDLASLRIHAEVSESDVGELRTNQKASFSVPAHPNRSFDATVEQIGLDARRSAVAVYYPVELRAANPDGLLRPGMTATVRVAVATQENALAVRDVALRFRPEGSEPAAARSRVFRVEEAGLSEVHVRTGLSDGAFTAVVPETPGALTPGAEVALGVLLEPTDKGSGPGIKLGNR